jgi:DNA-binding CsgD family transcriptional regulator
MTTIGTATDPVSTQGTPETSSRPQRLPPRPVRLSPRERQIVTFITAGCSNQEIADCLGLRIQTVKNHLGRTYRKLGVPNRVHLAVFGVRHGLGAASSPEQRPAAEPDTRHSA